MGLVNAIPKELLVENKQTATCEKTPEPDEAAATADDVRLSVDAIEPQGKPSDSKEGEAENKHCLTPQASTGDAVATVGGPTLVEHEDLASFLGSLQENSPHESRFSLFHPFTWWGSSKK